MPSYYNRINGTLETGKTARSSDIHVIQSEIQDALQKSLIDIHGTGVVLGEDEDALKLTPTTQHVDQSNTNFDEEHAGLLCYGLYFRQPINIEKSSIDTIRLEMLNNSNIEVTVYAEIQDEDFNTISETNTILKVTDTNIYEPIDFVFNEDHLQLGRYYFVLRPVDISAIDLAINGDEVLYDTINPAMFKVKYDPDGTYSYAEDDEFALDEDTYGLQVSENGSDYFEARFLQDGLVNTDTGTDIAEKNFDLYFEHIFSSGNTYLINHGAAIILGEKVYPLDTHVTIDGPSVHGDRTDLVILTSEGQLKVIKGSVYNGEKIYPIDNTGLKIAYITTYKYGLSISEQEAILNGSTTLSEIQEHTYNRKVPSIEQDDENEMTRQRDILERLRRLEKKIKYQEVNNTPTRIKYNCEVDPILANNGVNEDADLRGEGSYGMQEGQAANGDIALTTGKSKPLSWSIIKDNYKYNYEKTSSTVKGDLVITDVSMPINKPSTGNIKSCMRCEIQLAAPGYAKPGDATSKNTNNKNKVGGVPYAKIDITIKKGNSTIDTRTVTTNNYGTYILSLWNIKKLKKGTNYKIYAKYNGKTVKSTMKVYANNHDFNGVTAKQHHVTVDVATVTAAQSTKKLPSTVIPGDDSFYKEKVDVDVEKGEVRIQHMGTADEYEKNTLLKDVKVFSSSEREYKLKKDKTALTSEYPVLNFTLESDTYIKSITPYVTKFKNLDKFRVIIFKNDFVFDKTKNQRKVIQKKISKTDAIFPTVFDSDWKSLSSAVKSSGGYKKLKKPVSFTIKEKDRMFDAGTYSLMICGHIDNKHKEGAIKITEYVTRSYKKDYGVATKCTGGSGLSVINMDISTLTNRSWDVLIEQKPRKYYDAGTLISKTIDTSANIKSCSVGKKNRNFKIPNGCSIDLYVSNNGGTTWVNANSGEVTFDGDGQSFRWKLEMKSNSTSTPKLYYNSTKQYAISFNLTKTVDYVPYEDYQKCYETPLLNANYITTKAVVNNLVEHGFSEWEFARLYMEDDDIQSKIDILFSYANDDNKTGMLTDKSQWGDQIFFSQVFADLTLDDFSTESVDYDNYEASTEYDEHNYRFKMSSELVFNDTSERALASPDIYYNRGTSAPYEYGDIAAVDENGVPLNDIHDCFKYQYVNNKYQYKDNSDNPADKYAGMHIVDGPMWKAVLKEGVTTTYTSNDVILGVTFKDILEIDESLTYLTIGLKPVLARTDENSIEIYEDYEGIADNDVTKTFFEGNMFDIVVSVNKHGEVDDTDASNGKAYTITDRLIANQYNEVTIDLTEDLKGFSASGIGSIGIRVKDPSKLQEGEGIQLGRITTGSENRRSYTPHLFTGAQDRIGWQSLKDGCQAYAMYDIGRLNENTTLILKGFYPITNYDKDAKESTITFTSGSSITAKYTMNSGEVKETTIQNDNINRGQTFHIWESIGTSRHKNTAYTQDGTVVTRKGSEINTKINKNKKGTYVAKDAAHQMLFYLPKNTTGVLFKIDTNIPYTIYDLIDIQYYVFSEYQAGQSADITTDKRFNVQYHKDVDRTYATYGNFSKGDIYINFYDTRDIENNTPVESFALPAWGRIQTSSHERYKMVRSWFKKRSSAVTIKTITIERRNPRKDEQGTDSVAVDDIYLALYDILFFNAEVEAALGPQMQMRIYPEVSGKIEGNTIIRKVGGIYRI